MQPIVKLVRQTVQEWNEDHAARLAAALAYYTVFSLAPLLVIILAISGFFWQRSVVEAQLLARLQIMLGEQGVEFVVGLLDSASNPAEGIAASLLSTVTLVLGAIGVFGQLKGALNTIWKVEPPETDGLQETIQLTFVNRLLAFLLIALIGLLILASLVVSTVLSSLEGFITYLLPAPKPVLQVIDILVSILLTTILFAALFKWLPNARVTWRDVWIGGLVTAILFSIGKFLIGWYLGNSTAGSSFGAAGSLVVILLWVYYSAQILLLGAEFTQVYANQYGSHIRPDEEPGKLIYEIPPSEHKREIVAGPIGLSRLPGGRRKQLSLVSASLRTLLSIFLAQLVMAFLVGYWETRAR